MYMLCISSSTALATRGELALFIPWSNEVWKYGHLSPYIYPHTPCHSAASFSPPGWPWSHDQIFPAWWHMGEGFAHSLGHYLPHLTLHMLCISNSTALATRGELALFIPWSNEVWKYGHLSPYIYPHTPWHSVVSFSPPGWPWSHDQIFAVLVAYGWGLRSQPRGRVPPPHIAAIVTTMH